jgi:AraC-like DNA-binding protein
MPDVRHTASQAEHLWSWGGVHHWPAGGASRSQTHERGHLVYAARGLLTVETDRGTSVVPINRVTWTPAATRHRHRAHGDTDMRIVFVSSPLTSHLPDRPVVLAVSGLARQALLTLTGPRSYDPAVRARHRDSQRRLLRVLLDELQVAPERPLELPRPQDPRLRELARLLDEDLSGGLRLTDLGPRIGASARTLSRLLTQELGMTFYQWRTQIRVYRALVLLAEGHDVTYTAHACGWANVSNFIAAFTDLVGTSPGRHRQAMRASDARYLD